MQLIVLGMHRSGTSIVARILNMMGVYFGTEDVGMLPQKDNPKGFWERNDVVALNDFALRETHASWRNVLPFELNRIGEKAHEEFKSKAAAILQCLEPNRPWFIKDPRISLTLPLWQPLFELPIYIIVDRNPLEIARSLEIRDKMPIGEGLALWQRYMVDALNFTRNGRRIFISHSDFLANPVEATKNLARQLRDLGVPLPRDPAAGEIEAFVDPKLYCAKSQSQYLEVQGLLSDSQLNLYNLLQPDYSGDRQHLIDPTEASRALYEFLPLEIAWSQRNRAEVLEKENTNLRQWLIEEKKKRMALF